jgi:hypothetical protein
MRGGIAHRKAAYSEEHSTKGLAHTSMLRIKFEPMIPSLLQATTTRAPEHVQSVIDPKLSCMMKGIDWGSLTVICILSRDYRRVLDWWSDLLDSLIHRVATIYSSLLHTQTSVHSHVFTAVAWHRLPTTADVLLPLGSRTGPGFSYQILAATSQSQSYFTTGGLAPNILSRCQTSWDPRPEIVL